MEITEESKFYWRFLLDWRMSKNCFLISSSGWNMGHGLAWKDDWDYNRVFQSILPTSVLSFIPSAILCILYLQIFSSRLLTGWGGSYNSLLLESHRIYLNGKLWFDYGVDSCQNKNKPIRSLIVPTGIDQRDSNEFPKHHVALKPWNPLYCCILCSMGMQVRWFSLTSLWNKQ